MSEAALTDAWLYSRLHGDATLLAACPGGMHVDIAPENTVMPCLVYQLQASEDLMPVGPWRVWADQTYLIKAIGITGYTPLATIMNRVETLLHLATASVTGGLIVECVRQSEIQYAETDGPVLYRHLGALYRIRTQKAG